MRRRPVVWFVDDLEENRERFAADHGDTFNIEMFETPQEVLDRLKKARPDALLCDIFFYDTQEEAQAAEEKIEEEKVRIHEIAHEIGALDEDRQAGVELIRNVTRLFRGNPPFPVYAYTSKGPYLLDGPALDRLAECGATVLFKKRYSRHIEKMIICGDIEEFRERRKFHLRLSPKAVIGFLVAIGLVAWVMQKVLNALWRLIFGS